MWFEARSQTRLRAASMPLAFLRLRFCALTFALLLSFVSHPSADQTFYACPNDCGKSSGYGECEVSDFFLVYTSAIYSCLIDASN